MIEPFPADHVAMIVLFAHMLRAVNMRCTFFGINLRFPVMIAPSAMHGQASGLRLQRRGNQDDMLIATVDIAIDSSLRSSTLCIYIYIHIYIYTYTYL